MTELRQRQPRERCEAFLRFVRRKPCCACWTPAPSQAAHIRMGNVSRGKRPTGIGEKPSDRWAVPLCAECHLDGPEAQHKIGEEEFWRRARLNPFAIAEEFWNEFNRERERCPSSTII